MKIQHYEILDLFQNMAIKYSTDKVDDKMYDIKQKGNQTIYRIEFDDGSREEPYVCVSKHYPANLRSIHAYWLFYLDPMKFSWHEDGVYYSIVDYEEAAAYFCNLISHEATQYLIKETVKFYKENKNEN